MKGGRLTDGSRRLCTVRYILYAQHLTMFHVLNRYNHVPAIDYTLLVAPFLITILTIVIRSCMS